MRLRHGQSGFLLAVAVLLGVSAAKAAPVDLRFVPPDTTVAAGEPGHVSVVLEQAVTVRTLDITVTYDPAVITANGGGPGDLFLGGGLNLFQDYEEIEPGRWHGLVVILGASVSTTGPGELYRWDFTGAADGITDVVAVEVYLSDAAGDWYPELGLTSTTVTVGSGLSAAGDAPAPPRAPRLVPNPFNPRTEFTLDLPAAGPVRLEVLDLRGRRTTVLHDGHAPQGSFRASWNGHDEEGRPAPGGVYVFRLRDSRGVHMVKGILLK